MLRVLLPDVASLIVTRASNPRSADPVQLAEVARALDASIRIDVEASAGTAIELAWSRSPLVLVAGSIFLLGDAMQHAGLHW